MLLRALSGPRSHGLIHLNTKYLDPLDTSISLKINISSKTFDKKKLVSFFQMKTLSDFQTLVKRVHS